MHNTELRLYVIVAAAFSVLGIAAGFWLGTAAGVLCTLLCLLLGGWSIAFTLWRYRQIKKLSGALAVAAAGGQVPDLRTNREGELSILQNDLYKITSALAGQADHLRQDKVFLANTLSDISHQLKTPLTSLLVHSDLLQDEALPEETRRAFLARFPVQLERMRGLVSSLLQLSRLDAAVVEFRREEIPLHRMLNQAVEPLLPLAEEADIALRIECPRTISWSGDGEWMREAVGNIIKNGVEHAPRGGEVRITCVENPLHTLLLIEDDGPGFSEKDLPRLFERFYRGEESGGGVGIGLALSKSIIQTQGGDVYAENREEGGARFVIKLFKPADMLPAARADMPTG